MPTTVKVLTDGEGSMADDRPSRWLIATDTVAQRCPLSAGRTDSAGPDWSTTAARLVAQMLHEIAR